MRTMDTRKHAAHLALLTVGVLLALPALAQNAFVNRKSPHVHPLDLSADDSGLVAVNTADHPLEVYTISGDRRLRRIGRHHPQRWLRMDLIPGLPASACARRAGSVR